MRGPTAEAIGWRAVRTDGLEPVTDLEAEPQGVGADGGFAGQPGDEVVAVGLGRAAQTRAVDHGDEAAGDPGAVPNLSGQDRVSFPLFFDPDFLATMHPLPMAAVAGARFEADRAERWDRASVRLFEGTSGEYLLGKVARVFPQLTDDTLRFHGVTAPD